MVPEAGAPGIEAVQVLLAGFRVASAGLVKLGSSDSWT